MHNKEWEDKVKEGIKNGDTRAFGRAYHRFYSPLCVIATRYTGTAEIAEEIVQETFLKLWESRKKINIRGSLHSYLSSAVRNSSINHLKHQLVERKYSSKKSMQLRKAVFYLQVSQEDGSSILISEEMENSLQDALSSLPDKCREIFLLHREEGLKYSEIAQKLNISQNTVQRQISIALEKLREKILPIVR